MTTKPKEKEPAFDPDLSPENIHNIEAAQARDVRYDSRKGCYVDEDGALTHDRFGQPL